VVDASGAAARPNQTVVVIGDRIHTVGAAGQVTIPRGARIVDADGMYLIPGL
jgi:imidazolonepropionase-like amidohydrolase